ncbi:hypothetical protein [Tenacibaculum finnmarkense]|uniref:hypothetical protein n=1 Tax=Tenacibaculum finnmarkense TaxID=2781243 RepID=UPI001E47DD67|nr:hypothetical protein [Tenacibaculum finnmarkense]MCD8403836.1 hypothetical protein [Tenacibaculum finnmarkense genomovar finnmarkense]
MTEKSIQNLINILNTGNYKETYKEQIFLRQISENVFLSKISSEITSPKIKPYYFIYFFFISNEREKFIGAIEDRGINDLHWYITKESRKNGYLTKALKDTIIPYIFNDENKDYDRQRITINKNYLSETNYLNSKKVAINLGFEALNEDETEFELIKEYFDWSNENITEKNKLISGERTELLKEKISNLHYEFEKICCELEMSYGNENILLEQLLENSRNIEYSKSKVDNLIFIQNDKINNIG